MPTSTSQMTPPVVWVLKAKTKWVMPLMIMAQAKKMVMPMPETNGMRRAKRPKRMRRTLRAMDQLMALGARAENEVGAVVMVILQDVKKWAAGMGGEYHKNEIAG
jgi:hypothetical protein